MCLPRRFRYLDVFINVYTDIHAIFPVIKMLSEKHQHSTLNNFPLTIPVLQPFACHSKPFLYGKLFLPSPFLPTKGRGHLLFIAILSLCQGIFSCFKLKTAHWLAGIQKPRVEEQVYYGKHMTARFHWQILKPEQEIGWHYLCINIFWLLLCSLLHRCPL